MNKILFWCFCSGLGLTPALGQSVGLHMYEGQIDRYKIKLYLHQDGPSYTGFYDYQKNGIPIHFSGNDTSAGYNGKILLKAFPEGSPGEDPQEEEFLLSRHGDSLTGNWKPTGSDASKALKVKLVVQKSSEPGLSYLLSHGERKLREKNEQSPSAEYDAAILWPIGQHPAVASFRKSILKFLNWPDTVRSPHLYLAEEKRNYLDEHMSEFAALADSDWVNYPYAYQVIESNRMELQSIRDEYLVLVSQHYSYSGGAHGFYARRYLNFDSKNRRTVTLNDVIKPSALQRIPAMLARSFRAMMGVLNDEPLTETGLFEDTIMPTENFYLTGTGIVFSYPPYEIGPYAMGELQIFLSFADLKPYLQPAFAFRISSGI